MLRKFPLWPGRSISAFVFAGLLLWAPLALALTPHVLRVRALGEPTTLDWNRASTWVEGFIIRNAMEGLVAVDAKLNAVPALAERWTVSPDRTIYTFHLRRGVKWSDGVPLKAQHFVDSWKRLLSPDTKSKYASFLFDIENAESFNQGSLKDFSKVGVHATDDHTLRVHLRAPISHWYWVGTFYTTYPVRLDLIDAKKDHWTKPGKMVTIGPFVPSAHEPGRSITLEKNPEYYGKRGNIDQIRLALVPDDAMALKLYENGQIDFLSKIASLERKRLKGRKDFYSWPDMRLVHLRLNTSKGPTANVSFRRAIALAINRPELAEIFEQAYQPATSFVPPGLLGYGSKAGVGHNIEAAKAELKKTGFDPATMPPLDLLTPSFDDQVILAQFVQSELKKNLGINVRIHILEPKRYYAPTLVHNDYAMQINFWGADFPDSDNFFSIFLGNSGLNRYRWSNTRYDKLVTDARSQTTRTEREKAYMAAQKILLEEEVATIPLYYGRINGLVRNSIKGFNPGPLDWWVFKDLVVK